MLTDSDSEEIVITELWEKIHEAREWALNHFNAKETENSNLIDPDTLAFIEPSFFIEFPEPDQMIAIPNIVGRPGLISFHYRLHFCRNGAMEWRGNHPIYGSSMPHLRIR